jgi:dihydropteroate synthase
MVMGVLNLTPDSFANDRPLVISGTVDVPRAVDAALRMEADGADIIDIGGESTRPGSKGVSNREELSRVVPVIEALQGRLQAPISIDTSKAEVAREALVRGVGIVNDVTGLSQDAALAEAVASHRAALIVMHMRGRPRSMYAEATYTDLVGEVVSELEASVAHAATAGVPASQVIVDPGIGFAKQAEHSYGVLAGLARIATALQRPVLVGPSRKSFLRAGTGDRPAHERDWGTAAAVTAAVLAGAHIVRVHAVAEMTQVVRVAEEIRRAATDKKGSDS